MGMVDRGAELGWISQYPHEQEILFGPLTGMQLMKTRVDRSSIVAEVRLSVNLNALTIEQVVAKLKRALASYVSANYASPGMSDKELEKYECITTEVTDACPCVGGVPGSATCPLKCITSAWWGNTSGPCCRPK